MITLCGYFGDADPRIRWYCRTSFMPIIWARWLPNCIPETCYPSKTKAY